MTREDAVRQILDLVAHTRNGEWWGDDTVCGGESELIAEGVAILDKIDGSVCYWHCDIESTICPLHKQPIAKCPLPTIAMVCRAPK